VAVQTNVTVNWTVTATPQRFSVLINVPSISGKTIGTGGYSTSYIEPIVYLPFGTTFSILSNQWQLEQCSPNAPATGYPTAFEYRGQQAEAARVLRYVEVLTGGFYATLTVSTATGAYGTIKFNRKRAIPAFEASAAGTFYLLLGGSGNVAPTTVTLGSGSPDSVGITVSYSGMTPGQSALLQDAVGTSQIILDARL
jgi:hypothetical protein